MEGCGGVQVAQLALPLFVQRAAAMLAAWAADLNRQRTELDEFMCLLEVLQLMQLPASVADAIIAPGSSMQVMQGFACLLCSAMQRVQQAALEHARAQ